MTSHCVVANDMITTLTTVWLWQLLNVNTQQAAATAQSVAIGFVRKWTYGGYTGLRWYSNAQNPLDTFTRNCPVDGEVANLMPTCWMIMILDMSHMTDSNWRCIDHDVWTFERTSSVTELCHTETHFTVTRGWSRVTVNVQEAPRCM